VTLGLGTEKFQARAAQSSGAERQRLFDAYARLLPFLNDYQKKTKRQIPGADSDPDLVSFPDVNRKSASLRPIQFAPRRGKLAKTRAQHDHAHREHLRLTSFPQ
jgi:hypothetical protein